MFQLDWGALSLWAAFTVGVTAVLVVVFRLSEKLSLKGDLESAGISAVEAVDILDGARNAASNGEFGRAIELSAAAVVSIVDQVTARYRMDTAGLSLADKVQLLWIKGVRVGQVEDVRIVNEALVRYHSGYGMTPRDALAAISAAETFILSLGHRKS